MFAQKREREEETAINITLDAVGEAQQAARNRAAARQLAESDKADSSVPDEFRRG